MDLSSRRVAGNAFSQLFFRALMVALSIITTRWLTRSMGVAGYANFGFFTTITTLFYAVGDWGTQLVMIRDGSARQHLNQFWWNAGGARFGLMVLGLVFYAVYVLWLPDFEINRDVFLWGGLILFFFSLKTTAQAVFQISQRHGWGAFLDFLSSLFFFLFLLIGRPSSLRGSVIGLVGAAVATAMIGLVGLVIFRRPEGNFDFGLVRRFLQKAWPMGWVIIVYSCFSRVTVFFLQQFGTEIQLGRYLLASKVYDNLILGAAYLMNVMYPVVSAWKASRVSPKKMSQLLSFGLTTLLIMGVGLLAVGWWGAGWLVNFLGGSEFTEAIIFMRGLMAVLVISYLNHLTGYVLLALSEQRLYFYYGVAGLVVSVSGHFLFYRWWGEVGVVAAILIAEMTVFVLSYRYLKEKLGYQIKFQPKVLGRYLVNEWLVKK